MNSAASIRAATSPAASGPPAKSNAGASGRRREDHPVGPARLPPRPAARRARAAADRARRGPATRSCRRAIPARARNTRRAASGSRRPIASSRSTCRCSSAASCRQRSASGKSALRARHDLGKSEAAFRELRLHRPRLSANRQAHGRSRRGGSTGITAEKSARSMPRRTSHHASTLRVARRVRHGGCPSASSVSGVWARGGNVGGAARRGVFGQRLAQPPAGLPRGDHRERAGKIERSPARPAAGEPGHRLRQHGRSHGRKWRRRRVEGMRRDVEAPASPRASARNAAGCGAKKTRARRRAGECRTIGEARLLLREKIFAACALPRLATLVWITPAFAALSIAET